MANSTSPVSSMFNLGNGLVEISALTSLIGSGAALSLALGNKGPAGFVWATMSSFGAMSFVKACLCAVIPPFLLDSFGTRSPDVDAVIGHKLELNKRFAHRNRDPVVKGIEIVHRRTDFDLESRNQERRYVNVFDQQVSNNLRFVSFNELGEGLKVYTYMTGFPSDPKQRAWTLSKGQRVDGIGISLYTIKLAEFTTLWYYNARTLALINFSSWLFFLIAGLVLLLHDIFHARIKPALTSRTDVLTDVRHSTLWKVIWGSSSFVSAVSIIACYIVLGRTNELVPFVIWTGYQIIWLFLRSLFFYMVGDRDTYRFEVMLPKEWKDLNPQQRRRIQFLAFSLSKYQQHIHPRGASTYQEDLNDLDSLDNLRDQYPSSPDDTTTTKISIDGVIGDTLLSSVAWLMGSRKGGYDFYDICIIQLTHLGNKISIPAARVTSPINPPSVFDDDEHQEIHTMHPYKGMNNNGLVGWWYWVPCSDGRWLFFRTSSLKHKQIKEASILSDDQVSEKLRRGDLFASLKDVSEVKETVENSRLACDYLLEFLK